MHEKESRIIRKFRERLDRGNLTDDVNVVFRIAGGMLGQRIEQEFILSGSGEAKTMLRDVLRSVETVKTSSKLDRAETRDLLRKIASGVDSLVPRSEARFLPDSVVGSVTIEVDGEKTKLYFLAGEEERAARGKKISPEMTDAIRLIKKKSQQLLKLD